ncbi:MAG: winged helix-turn-helix transcriptional regulator [Candidatus Taylorbacteria bacterium]|nr:winged helix-turn-helix transcriptional regulator [Candidatus Taylorbacteria bacterium]
MNDFRKFERVLKAIGNRRRLAILSYLKKHSEGTVGELAEILRLSFKATSKHLAVLYAAELVEREQRSLQMWYSLSSSPHRITDYVLRLL